MKILPPRALPLPAWLPVLLLLAASPGVQAQAAIPVEKLLFEPVPLDAATAAPAPLDGRDSSAARGVRPSGGATPAKPLDQIRRIEEYLAASEEYEAEDGPYSLELRENLHTLGLLYQERGNHEEAEYYLDRALSISRVNNGLNTPEQIPLLKDLARSLQARELYKRADEARDRIVEIQRANHGRQAPETVPALVELGDWNVQAFLDRSNIVINIDRVDAQRFLMDPNNFSQEVKDLSQTPLFKLAQAQNNFSSAINILIQAQDFDHPDLIALEHKLRTTYLLSFHRENILYEPDFYLTRKKRKTGSRLDQNAIEMMNSEEYEMGQASIDRSISYIVNREQVSPRNLADAMLEDADWDLLFARKVKAARRYQEVYGFFNANPDLQAAASRELFPRVPVVLPVNLPPPNSRTKLNIPADEEVNYLGWFDVSFAIDEYGKARRVRVLGKGGQVSQNMEFRLNQYLKNLQFRPRFDRDGNTITGPASYRYMVGY